ncbi:hypothetical protein F385_1505 [Pantoea agglomerans 299R]|nr:hypothetical protein F385_1505 [Pantoea agglomerans 299R]
MSDSLFSAPVTKPLGMKGWQRKYEFELSLECQAIRSCQKASDMHKTE